MFNQLLTHLSLSSLTVCIVVLDQVDQGLDIALGQVEKEGDTEDPGETSVDLGEIDCVNN